MEYMHSTASPRQGASQSRRFEQLQRARRELRREWAMLAGLEQLYELAGSDGVVVLSGGVRGWAGVLGCSLGWPKKLLLELERRNFIAGIEFYPGEGGQVAEVHLFADSISDRSEAPAETPAAARPVEAEDRGSHQDAELRSADSISDRSPPNPPCGTDHDSSQQQQHAHTLSREDDPTGGRLARLLRQSFPQADRALIEAWAADPRIDDVKAAHDALAGFPRATLADWRADLAAAEERAGIDTPPGFVLAIWSRGGRVTPPRGRPASRRRRQEVEAHVAPPAKPRAPAPEPPAETALLVEEPPAPRPRPAPAHPAWPAALGEARELLGRQEYNAWLLQAQLLGVEGNVARIAVPTPGGLTLPQRITAAIRRACMNWLGVHQVQIVAGGSP